MGKGRMLVFSLLVALAGSIASGRRRRVQHWTPQPDVEAQRERMERARTALLRR